MDTCYECGMNGSAFESVEYTNGHVNTERKLCSDCFEEMGQWDTQEQYDPCAD